MVEKHYYKMEINSYIVSLLVLIFMGLVIKTIEELRIAKNIDIWHNLDFQYKTKLSAKFALIFDSSQRFGSEISFLSTAMKKDFIYKVPDELFYLDKILHF